MTSAAQNFAFCLKWKKYFSKQKDWTVYFWFKDIQEYMGSSLCFTHAQMENGCLQNLFLGDCYLVVIVGIFIVISQYICK